MRTRRARRLLSDVANKRAQTGHEEPPGFSLIEGLPEDTLSHVAQFLSNGALVVLSSTSSTVRAGPVGVASETAKQALKRSVLNKIMMSEEALLSTSTLYAQGRSLTDEDGVMLVYLLARMGTLARLTTVWLFSNMLGDGTCRALARAFAQLTRTSPHPSSALKLRVLWLSNNRIGCQGVTALAESLADVAVGGQLIELW